MIGVSSNLVHEDDKILEMLRHELIVASEKCLEHFKGLHGSFFVIGVDGLFQYSNH